MIYAEKHDIRAFLSEAKRKYSEEAYNGYIKSFRRFYRDFLDMGYLVDTFQFVPVIPKPKLLPERKELIEFHDALDVNAVRSMFVLFCVSGLRRSELLGLTQDQINFAIRMITPHHYTRTKRGYITFYNSEVEPPQSKKTFAISRCKTFQPCWKRAKQKTGLDITPNVLRSWFQNELALLGVADRFIDAFCGRVPNSIPAGHYTDYSPQSLKKGLPKGKTKSFAEMRKPLSSKYSPSFEIFVLLKRLFCSVRLQKIFMFALPLHLNTLEGF